MAMSSMSSIAAEGNGMAERSSIDSSPPALQEAAMPWAPAVRRLRTYVVEDNEIIRENLVATLEELARVAVVGSAVDEWTAVQWLTDPGNHCDLVIVDIFLKSGSGLGVLRSFTDSQPPPRLVVLSNYATADMRRKCLELGAAGVFDKSNDIDALLEYCDRLAVQEYDGSPKKDN
jgi:DNA-binding NarL/FixJ family response regulator